MKEKFRFRVYSVNQCGYYSRATDKPEFGGLAVTLEQMREWIENKSLIMTGTYPLREEDKIFRTFCRGIYSSEFGDYFVATWNEIPHQDSATTYINANEPAESAKVNIQKLSADSIPGYPAYFWVLPERQQIITVTPIKSQNGMDNLKKYIRNFLNFYSPSVLRKSDSDSWDESQVEVEIEGYLNESSTYKKSDIFPRFEAYLYSRGGKNIQYIKENLAKVRRVLHKRELDLSKPPQKRLLGNLYDFMGLDEIPQDRESPKVNYSVDLENPTIDQFESIVREWESHSLETDSLWDDVGFLLKDELEKSEEKRWLGRFYISKAIQPFPVS
ncbi:hypothetical protein DYY88_06675 [Leptolyngbya iicbica LK]|uniref:Uncharacterized protein n=2 Tax=Cyanophyceae TaxID=3028117 RepID=A0A4Q7EIE2_9CYAN|nr:hypothetical protein [Leptolyngbya sp. LK]RZM82876.1 hypothetical protein DYY88_06675 [Leptolyngbya sp. LK]